MRRLGGGYGGKITNSLPIASSCAVAAVKLNRPVRIVLDIENMIDMCSSRLPYLISYEVRRFRAGHLASSVLSKDSYIFAFPKQAPGYRPFLLILIAHSCGACRVSMSV